MISLLTSEERKTLLRLAREAISLYLAGRREVKLPKVSAALQERCGAFVTLTRNGKLRGCIGHIVGRLPLVETVREMAIAAATSDPRFHHVTAEEFHAVDIEISVLSPLRHITDVNDIEVGKHGIVMSRGRFHGVLLPQVATEYGWDRHTFLEHTCLKAGLDPEAWSDPKTAIEIFSAQVFGEEGSVS